MDQRVVKTAEEASAGRKTGVVRYILAISTVLVVILFVVAYVISV